MPDLRQEWPHPIAISPLGFGNAPRGTDPMGQTGIVSNGYRPTPQALALGTVIQALQDPRNAWMGTGMAGGTIRGLGALRGKLFQPEMGGFRVPTSTMRNTPGMGFSPLKYNPLEVPGGEQGLRADYVGTIQGINELPGKMTHISPVDLGPLFEQLPSEVQHILQQVMRERIAFNKMQAEAQGLAAPSGGDVLPDYLMKRFGFGGADQRALENFRKSEGEGWYGQ